MAAEDHIDYMRQHASCTAKLAKEVEDCKWAWETFGTPQHLDQLQRAKSHLALATGVFDEDD